MHRFVRDGLTFDVSDEGPGDGRVVIALHGFPEDRQCWASLAAPLTEAGYRVLAPDQRGYSPAARPGGRRSYTLDELSGDILALADTAGARRFDLVGHDWGALVGWALAGRHPERVRTLTALSVPHPKAFGDSLLRSGQLLHSWYMLFFQVPAVPELVLRRTGRTRAVDQLVGDGLDVETAGRYASRLTQKGAMTGPLNWYRALPLDLRRPVPPVEVPTLYVWGDGDHYVSRTAAERCGRYVHARYRFERLAGASHWLPTEAGKALAPMIADHLVSTPR